MPHITIAPVRGCYIELKNRISIDYNLPDFDFDFDFDFPGFDINPKKQGILFLVDSSGSMTAAAAVDGINQAYNAFGGSKMRLFGLDLYGGTHGTMCKQVESISVIINSAYTIPFSGSGDDDYPFSTLMSYASDANVYKYIAVIGDYEFSLNESDSTTLSAAYGAYGIT